jgi:hypothetical protein
MKVEIIHRISYVLVSVLKDDMAIGSFMLEKLEDIDDIIEALSRTSAEIRSDRAKSDSKL